MDEYYSVIQFLPEPLRTELKAMPPERAARVQEIRLRAGQAVQFTVGGAWQPAQQLLPAAQTALAIGPRMLRSCFAALCRDSAYAYEDELKQGYFTLPGGSRVGVAGVCGPAGFADITSLNLRVARQVPCVLPPQLRRALDALNGGILVVGTPGSGKTTFLRSIIRYLDTARRIFCVADERGELLTAGHTVHCDVYTRCTKAQAIQMALRCMNPKGIVCDELGTQADLQAVEAGLACGVGDEGGFAPRLKNEEQALELILRAIEDCRLRPGEDMALALDAAAGEWQTGNNMYLLPKENRLRTPHDLLEYWRRLTAKYPIISLEDPAGEDDWDLWRQLTEAIGKNVQLVGDDLFVTQKARLEQGLARRAANAVLIKPNQVGTLTETLETVALAQQSGYGAILSHRSGETEDTTIADLAVATACGQIKTGAPCRSERTAKYNRLLRIEAMLEEMV